MDVLSMILGVPESDRAELSRLADIAVERDKGMRDLPPRAIETSMALVVYYAELVAERRRHRQAVLDAVGRAGMAPVDMRYFAAREGKPADYCRLRVRPCEIYVAVIGLGYGSMVPGEVVSYTELEFDEATTAGLPRLVFLLADTAGSPAVLADADRGGAVEGALEGNARCAQATGDAATARTLLRQASEIYERIGAAEAAQLMTELAEPNTD
jgi:hypothetical protein